MTDGNDEERGSRSRDAARARPGGRRSGRPAAPGPDEVAPEGGGAASPDRAADQDAPKEDRIAKVIARAGIASRRDAEAMIEAGRVTLNGAVVTSPALNVSAADAITVDGEPLPLRERTRLWLFHKPRGLVTTFRDPQGRPTVFEALPEEMPRVVAVGRLDINTEGLLLLTNDGGLAKIIAHPETGWTRRYRVRARGEVAQDALDRLRGGITVDGMEYGPIEARLDRVQGDNSWLTLSLREGKNREVKRVLEELGLQVNRLIRLSFGPFQLGEIEPGLVEEVRTKVLREQLGQALAAEAGVDFESPVREPIAPFGRETARPVPAGRGRTPDRPGPERRAEGRRGDGRDGPRRGGREGGERPPRRVRDEAGDRPAPRPSAAERRMERPRTAWRAEQEGERPARSRAPRGDPKAGRAESAGRPRQRVGAIGGAEGRRVLVERVLPGPEEGRAGRRERGSRSEDGAARPDRPERGGRDRAERGGPPSRTGARPPGKDGRGRPGAGLAKPGRSGAPGRPGGFGDRSGRPGGPGGRFKGPGGRPGGPGGRSGGPSGRSGGPGGRSGGPGGRSGAPRGRDR